GVDVHAGLSELLLVLHELLRRGCSAARRLEHALAFAETHDQQHVLHASPSLRSVVQTPRRRSEDRAIDTRTEQISRIPPTESPDHGSNQHKRSKTAKDGRRP